MQHSNVGKMEQRELSERGDVWFFSIRKSRKHYCLNTAEQMNSGVLEIRVRIRRGDGDGDGENE